MQRTHFWAVVLLLAACSADLPHEAPFDENAPLSKQARAKLSGVIHLEGETDHSQVTVQLQNGERTYSVQTLPDGSVSLTGIVPGSYTLNVTTRYFQPVTSSLTLALAQEASLGSLEIEAKTAPVVGKAAVQTQSGALQGGVNVKLARVSSVRGGAAAAPGFLTAAKAATEPGETYTTVSDNDGTYEIPGVKAGIYTVTAVQPGAGTLTVQKVRVTGEDGTVEVEDMVILPMFGRVDIRGKNAAGAVSTSTVTVSLDSTGSPSYVELASDPLFLTAVRFSMRATTTVTLAAGDGVKNLYARYYDELGTVSSVGSDSVVLDQTPPQAPSFTIANASPTNSATLTFNYSAADASRFRVGQAPGCNDVGDVTYGAGTYTLPIGTGSYTYCMVFFDALGNSTSAISRSVVVDQVPPNVTDFRINFGQSVTSSNVLTIDFIGVLAAPTRIQISEDAGFTGADWQAYSSTKMFLASQGNDTKTVYVRIGDDAGNEQFLGSKTITIDNTPPSNPYLYALDPVTTGATVRLSLGAGSVQDMKLSEDAAFAGALWEPYVGMTTFTLSAGDGSKTIYAKFRKASLVETGSVSVTVVRDAGAPTLASLRVNDGAAVVSSPAVTLNLSAVDTASGLAAYKVNTVNSFTSVSPLPYQSTDVYPLTGTDGTKTLWVVYGDRAGNYSAAVSVSVLLDRTQPAVTGGSVALQRLDGTAVLNGSTIGDSRIRLVSTVTDLSLLEMQVTTNGIYSAVAWEPYSAAKIIDLPPTGTANVSARVRDGAGHIVDLINSVSVSVDTVAPTGTVSLTSLTPTNNPVVILSLGSEAGSQAQASADPLFTGAAWFATADTSVTLSAGDGIRTIYVRFRDAAGNVSAAQSLQVTLDQAPPQGADFTITAGAITNNRTVGLTFTAIGASDVRVQEGASCGGTYAAYGPAGSAALTSANDGTKSISVQFKDAVGNETICLTKTIELDETLPTVGFVLIDDGAPSTTYRVVSIDVSVTGATQMQVAENSTFSGAAWQPVTSSVAWTLSAGEGTKTIFARFRDDANNVVSGFSNSIMVDTLPPASPTLSINGGAPYATTSSASVTLAAGDAAQMQISNDGVFDTETVVALSSPAAWTLSPGEGFRIVYARFWDDAGNISSVASQSIYVDLAPPRGTILIASGAARVASESVTLNLTAIDDGSGVRGVKLINQDVAAVTGQTEVSYDATKAWTLPAVSSGTEVLQTVWYMVIDKAGRSSAPVSDTIIVDKLEPVGSISLSSAVTNQTLVGVDLTFAADTTEMKLSAGNACAGGNWLGASTQTLWTLSAIDGPQTVSVRFHDAVGNQSTCYSAGVILDTNGPVPTLLTLTGSGTPLPGYSDSSAITADYGTSAADCAMAEFSEDVGFVYVLHTETACSNTIPYTFSSATDGFKNLYLRFLDSLGNTGPVTGATIVVDANAPVVSVTGGFTIAQESWVKDPNITLQLSAAGATRVRYGEGAGCGFVPETYLTAKSLTLSGGDAAKTVSVEYLDDAGNASACYAQTVTLDTFVGAFTLGLQGHDGYAAKTASQAVTVTVAGIDTADVVEMRVSNFVGFTGSSWETLQTAFDWLLLPGDGSKTVYVNVRDRAGNEYQSQATTILLQTPPNPPAIQVSDIDGDGFALSATSVELRWSIPTGSAQLELERFVVGVSSDFVAVATFGVGTSTYMDSVTQPGHTHNYRMRAVDDIGNRSAWSLGAQALPFQAATEATWVRNVTSVFRFDIGVNPGTFSLSSQYSYEDVTGNTYTQQLVDNQTAFLRPVGWGHFNEKLLLRTANGDNSLVYASSVPLGVQVREAVDTAGYVGLYTSLALDADGNVHISYMAGTNPDLNYATNASGSWVVTSVDTLGLVGYFSSLALDAAGKAHIGYYDLSNRILKYATNKSGSWVTANVDTVGDVGQYLSLAVDAAGKVHISYYDNTSFDLKYVTNTSGSWVPSVVDSAGDVGQHTSIKIDAAGKVHIGYYDNTNGDLKYATNASGSWVPAAVDTAGNVGQFTSLALDSGDKVYIGYYDASNGDLKYATNASGSWVPAAVDTAGNVGEFPSLAFDSAGKLRISYYDVTNGDLKYATNASGAWVAVTVDTGGTVGLYTSLALDSADRIHISYWDNTNADLKYFTTASGSKVATAVDSAGFVGEYTSLGRDSTGKYHISYYDGGNGDLKYTTNASGTWVPTAVDTVGDVGRWTSLAVDAAGKVHISYDDFTNGDLKYATNASGSWVATPVDTGGNVGLFTSLALDAAGKVHISYYDATNRVLKYATNASGAWVAITVDSVWESGYYTSLKVDAAGKVHISYYDATFSDLRYATNASGSWVIKSVDAVVSLTPTTTSLAVDAAGKVHIGYYEGGNGDLKYATNASGAWVAVVVDTGGFLGFYTSLAVDAAGKVHITYADGTNGDLKYASNASGSWVAVAVDTSGSVGNYTSLVLDTAGTVHVSYYDGSNWDLKYASNFNGSVSATTLNRVTAF